MNNDNFYKYDINMNISGKDKIFPYILPYYLDRNLNHIKNNPQIKEILNKINNFDKVVLIFKTTNFEIKPYNFNPKKPIICDLCDIIFQSKYRKKFEDLKNYILHLIFFHRENYVKIYKIPFKNEIEIIIRNDKINGDLKNFITFFNDNPKSKKQRINLAAELVIKAIKGIYFLKSKGSKFFSLKNLKTF